MSKEFENLLEQYWDLAYLEGKSGISHGDKANEVLHALRKLAEQPAPVQQEPVAWRWLYNGQPDSEKHFSMPGPDAEVISLASACEFPRTVQYLYTSPQPAHQEPSVWTATRLWNRKDTWTCPADIEKDLLNGCAHGIKENKE